MSRTHDVDELLRLWVESDPDPVDLFEDDLAAKLGLHQGPGCRKKHWRRLRVEFINTETEGLGEDMTKGPTGNDQHLKPERVQRENDAANTDAVKPERPRETDQEPLSDADDLEPEGNT